MAIALTVEEALKNVEAVGKEYRVRGIEDLECWIRWGGALINLREAHRQANKGRAPSKKQMESYCNPFGINVATGYKWVLIATNQSQIRLKLEQEGRESADQKEILGWLRKGGGSNSRTKSSKEKSLTKLLVVFRQDIGEKWDYSKINCKELIDKCYDAITDLDGIIGAATDYITAQEKRLEEIRNGTRAPWGGVTKVV